MSDIRTFTVTVAASIDVEELSYLLGATGQNGQLHPMKSPDGTVVRADPRSFVPGGDYMERQAEDNAGFLGYRRRKCLVAFGRAVSDKSLTASIHDLAVAPSLQRRGFGTKVLRRIVSDLYQRGICDISAISTPTNRPFFAACGFDRDVLNTTTMFFDDTQT